MYTYSAGQAEAPRFLPLPAPSEDQVARVLAGTARRIQRLIEERAKEDDENLARDEPLLAQLAAASLRSRIATGPRTGEPWRRLGDRVEPDEKDIDPDASARVPQHAGMSLHANVAVPAHDRQRLERLCRYVARPPLASERLQERDDGRLTLRLKTRWRDGTTHILMERSELIERLVPLIPPPRSHQVRYHGILAPGASQRDWIVPTAVFEPGGMDGSARDRTNAIRALEIKPEPSRAAEADALDEGHLVESVNSDSGRAALAGGEPGLPDRGSSCDAPARGPLRRSRWASLLQRVFEIDALRCPRCGSTLRLLAAIEDPAVARQILECLDLPVRAPPLQSAAANAPDLSDEVSPWFFDQTRPCDEPYHPSPESA